MSLARFITKVIPFSLLGAVVATICDANHVFTGTLSYPEPFALGQGWFVFPGFFFAFTVMALNYEYTTKLFPKSAISELSRRAGDWAPFVESLLFFMMIYLLSGFGNYHPTLLSVIFFSTFFFRLAFTYEKAFIFLFAILLGIGGMFVEGAMTKFDLVHYREPEIFGVPYWLGGVYMHGALALRDGMRVFVYRK